MRTSKFEELDRIVNGVARKYQSKWCSHEDLYQELWIKVSELLQKHGDEIEPKLVAKCCYNTAVDLYRYNRIRYESTAEYFETDGYGDDGVDSIFKESSDTRLTHVQFTDNHTHMMISELLDMFECNSIERNFLLIKLYTSGNIEIGEFPEDTILLKVPSSHKLKDGEIALLLGFKSSRPPKWNKIKNQIVRNAVLAYLFED